MNKDTENHLIFRYCNNEINFILNKNMLNVKTILHLHNVAWDSKNNSIKNEIKSRHGNMEIEVAGKTSLRIVALLLSCDIEAEVLFESEA